MMTTYVLYFSGNICYEEFAAFFRRKECLVVQYLFLLLFLVVASLVMEIPAIISIAMAILMLYAFILVSLAKTVKQQLLYFALWAISSFITLCIILLVAVEYFGFQGFWLWIQGFIGWIMLNKGLQWNIIARFIGLGYMLLKIC